LAGTSASKKVNIEYQNKFFMTVSPPVNHENYKSLLAPFSKGGWGYFKVSGAIQKPPCFICHSGLV
jgi:hypothetical protein